MAILTRWGQHRWRSALLRSLVGIRDTQTQDLSLVSPMHFSIPYIATKDLSKKPKKKKKNTHTHTSCNTKNERRDINAMKEHGHGEIQCYPTIYLKSHTNNIQALILTMTRNYVKWIHQEQKLNENETSLIKNNLDGQKLGWMKVKCPKRRQRKC